MAAADLALAPVVEHRGRAMASELQVVVVGADDGPGALALGADLVRRLERCWTRFEPSSDISRINAAGGDAVPVAPETIVLLRRMVQGWRRTGGRYDPTILRAPIDNGYAASKDDPYRRTVVGPGAWRGALDEIDIDAERCTVTAPVGCALDPGGIGKGLAADLTVSALIDAGALGAMVCIGGDLSLAGQSADPAGWIVDVEQADPADGVLCSLLLAPGGRRGIATSSTLARRWRHGRAERHHLIDPATGLQAITDLAAVTVLASTAWEAEVHATDALLAGAARATDQLEMRGLDGIVIGLDGRVECTYALGHIDLRPAGPRPAA